MSTITASQVKELREATNVGMMECKKALTESGGDLGAAIKLLRERGMAIADKKASRVANEGLIASDVVDGGKIGVIVEVNCETDFVARTPEFLELAQNLAMQVAAMSPRFADHDSVPEDEDGIESEELLLEQAYIRDPSITVAELIAQTGARTGENVLVRRFCRFALGE